MLFHERPVLPKDADTMSRMDVPNLLFPSIRHR